MNIKALLAPKLIDFITSNWLKKLKRKLFILHKTVNPSVDEITFYLRVNDPYSYLLLQVLPDFLASKQKKLTVEILLDLNSDLNLEINKQADYALKDAKRLAQNNQLAFPEKTKQPSLQNIQLATSILLANNNQPEFLQLCRLVCDALWLQQSDEFGTNQWAQLIQQYGKLALSDVNQQLTRAKNKLQQKGHYQSGMLYYGGEWYWAIDRLWHLDRRLPSQLVDNGAGRPPYFQRNASLKSTKKTFPSKPQIVDFYFSFRSPYSYLAAQRLFKLSQNAPNIILNIKPVLPMVMRGLKVSKSKKMYIVHDAKREADRYHLPFGKIADPLGGGIEHCMALFYFAKQHNKQNQFVDSISKGIWAEGIDTHSNKGLRQLVCRAGLDWDQAKLCLEGEDWRVHARNNQRDLDQIGLWGVPSFQYKSFVVWGQDRIALLEQALSRQP